MVHIRPCDGDALRFAAGQLMGVVVFLAREPHRLQYFGHQRFDGGTACADHFKCEGDVLPYRLVVEQLVILEDKADLPAIMRHLPCGQASQIVAGDADLAIRGFLLAKQQAQQGGLAGTGRAHKKDEITSIDVKIDVIQCGTRALWIDFAHMFKRDQRHRVVPPPIA